VNAIKRNIEKEWLVLRLTGDDAAGLVAEEVRRVAFFLHGLTVAIPVEFAAPQVREVIEHPEVMSVMMVKAAGQRQEFRFEFPEMPFADDFGGVARLLEGIRQGAFGQRQSPGGVRTDD